jgi:hypothetical protein
LKYNSDVAGRCQDAISRTKVLEDEPSSGFISAAKQDRWLQKSPNEASFVRDIYDSNKKNHPRQK